VLVLLSCVKISLETRMHCPWDEFEYHAFQGPRLELRSGSALPRIIHKGFHVHGCQPQKDELASYMNPMSGAIIEGLYLHFQAESIFMSLSKLAR
jgi:hypothetical protein